MRRRRNPLLHFVLVGEDVEGALQAAVLAQQYPDPRADRIEAEVAFAGEVEQYAFAADFLEQHVVGGIGLPG